MKAHPETFTFATLGEMRDWLNLFSATDLDTVYPDESDHITLRWIEKPMGDGSSVYDVSITTS